MGNRIAVMSDGHLQQVGTPQELYDVPINRFVAGFIGSPAMNFVEVATNADGTRLEAPSVSIALPDGARDAVRSAGRTVMAGLRPEHFEVGPATGGAGAQVNGIAEVVEYLGNQELLHVKVGDLDLVAIVDSSERMRPGQDVTLHVPVEKVYLFDTESDLSLAVPRSVAAA